MGVCEGGLSLRGLSVGGPLWVGFGFGWVFSSFFWGGGAFRDVWLLRKRWGAGSVSVGFLRVSEVLTVGLSLFGGALWGCSWVGHSPGSVLGGAPVVGDGRLRVGGFQIGEG